MIKLREIPNTVVNLKTEKEYSEYMQMLKKTDWVQDIKSPSRRDFIWFMYGKYTCMTIKNSFTWEHKGYCEDHNYQILTLKELKEKLMSSKWKQGDIIVNDDGQNKILGTCGDIIFISDGEHFDITNPLAYTQRELEEKGWKLESDKVEVEVEGNKKWISRESAKELNLI